jgi:hypothetical protein
MSHYVVAVISNHEDDIHKLLAPYNENLEVESYIDATKAQVIQEGKDAQKRIKERIAQNTQADPDYTPSDWEQNLLKLKTDEEFYNCMIEGYDVDEDGNRLTSYNPDSKWDWYVIGGRWPGLLKLKDGSEADMARIKDVNFEPDEKLFKEALDFWDSYVLEQDKEKYQNTLYKREYYLENYTRKGFARQQSTFYTRAVITPDGEWHEVGTMGWFGMSSESGHERTDWADEWYDKFIKNENPEAILTIVDCHI